MKTCVSSLLAFVLFTIAALAQPPVNDPNKNKKSGPEAAPSVKKEDDIPRLDTVGSVFLIACDSQPNKVLVLDSTGKWLSAVKSVEIKFEIGQPVVITCTLYEGYLKPTKPQVKSWQLAQMKTVAPTEFQQMVDSVQSNPDAIKDMLKKGE